MFRIWRGDEVLDVAPGGIALLPRHQVHTFKNIGMGPLAASSNCQAISTWESFAPCAINGAGDFRCKWEALSRRATISWLSH
ncbi:hypothetical protein [Sinorhizobium numidicum]|uniref:hypothetical protein n=1 Tax=Sinorhizobium numidicum TaxID=680248 RepID=UPI003CC8BF82